MEHDEEPELIPTSAATSRGPRRRSSLAGAPSLDGLLGDEAQR